MGDRLRIASCFFVVAALAAPQAVLSAPGTEHGGIIVRLPGRASQSTILPDDERRLLAMVNRVRRAHGLSPLTVDASLRSAARQHAQDMALRGYVGHGSLNGQTLRDRLARVVPPGVHVSENVAVVQTIEQGHTAFVASRPHLHNMLDPTFRRIGIGVATAGDMGITITEDFA